MQRLNLPSNQANGADSIPAVPPPHDPNIVTDEQAISSAANADIPVITGPPETGTLTPGGMGSGVAVGSLIDGKTATELMDSVLPAVLVFALYKAGMQIKKTELQLTEREKNTLAPLMQKCMDALMLNFESPFVALGVSMAVIYGGKIMEKGGVAWLDKQTADKVKAAAAKQKPVDKVEEIMKRKNVQTVVSAETGKPHEFPFEAVEAFRKKRRISTSKAVPLMLRLLEAGKMDKQGNQLS